MGEGQVVELVAGKHEKEALRPNPEGPLYGKKKVVIYATCLVNHNKPSIGMGTQRLPLIRVSCQSGAQPQRSRGGGPVP